MEYAITLKIKKNVLSSICNTTSQPFSVLMLTVGKPFHSFSCQNVHTLTG